MDELLLNANDVNGGNGGKYRKPLPDIAGSGLKILFVGYNPGLESAAKKHHYANRSNRFWKLLFESGITPYRFMPEEDRKLLDHGFGSTNIADRQSRSSDEIDKRECLEGCKNLKMMIKDLEPQIVCYVGIGVYAIFSEHMAGQANSGSNRSAKTRQTKPAKQKIRTGLQENSLVEGSLDFVCYNPSGRNTVPYKEQLDCFIGLKTLVKKTGTHPEEAAEPYKEVTAAIIIKDGRVLIAQRGIGDRLEGRWEFPGGKTKQGETARECLKREIFEELDMAIDVGEEFGESIYRYPHGAIRLRAFICRWISGGPELKVHKKIEWLHLPVPDAASNSRTAKSQTEDSQALEDDILNKYDFAPADIPLVKKLMEAAMQYRKFGDLDIMVSRFGFGIMRLPLMNSDISRIDEKEATAMIHYAIDNGVNYFDTAYIYHGGNAEEFTGKALKGGYREKIMLTTKLPCWLVNTTEDIYRFFDEQMTRLQTDYLDFYLIHSLDGVKWRKLKELGIIEFFEKGKKSGKIRHVGFSFHGLLSDFKEILDDYCWEMCQIQLNFLDENYQAGVEGLKYAGEKGIPVVIMEPLMGGGLARNVPEEALRIWDEGDAAVQAAEGQAGGGQVGGQSVGQSDGSYGSSVKRSPVEWAFRWLCDFPEVTVVLSGVSTMEQLKDNIRIFSGAMPRSLGEKEQALYPRVRKVYKDRIKVGCTGCCYCQPCPKGIEIPEIFKLYNNAFIFDDFEESINHYAALIKPETDPVRCTECGTCEDACPQGINVIEKLKEANKALAAAIIP